MSSFLGAGGGGLDTRGPSPRLAASALSHGVRELFSLLRRVAALKKKPGDLSFNGGRQGEIELATINKNNGLSLIRIKLQ